MQKEPFTSANGSAENRPHKCGRYQIYISNNKEHENMHNLACYDTIYQYFGTNVCFIFRNVYFSNDMKTSSPKGNDRSPVSKQVFLNSSKVGKRFFQLVKGS